MIKQKFISYLAKVDNYYVNYLNLHNHNILRLINYNENTSGVKANCITYLEKDFYKLKQLHPNVKFINIHTL